MKTILFAVITTLSLATTDRVRDAVPFAGGMLVVTGGESDRTVAMQSADGASRELSTLAIRDVHGERLVVADGNHWWYAATGMREQGYGTTFLRGEGESVVVERFVAHAAHGPNLLLPLVGERPSAVFLHFPKSGTVAALEVRPDGVQERGTFASDRYALSPRAWSAARVGAERIALVSAEDSRVILRLVSFDGIEERVLAQGEQYLAISVAIDGRKLAVVTETTARTVKSTIVDPDATTAPQWTVLGRGRTPSVVATNDGFVAAWSRMSDSVVQVRTLTGDETVTLDARSELPMLRLREGAAVVVTANTN